MRVVQAGRVIKRVGYVGFGCAAALVVVLAPSTAQVPPRLGEQASSSAHVAASTRFVTYNGVRVTVPAGWPVVDLRSHPRACLRFDRTAVYLGTPGAQSDCPAHAVGRTDTIWLRPVARTPQDGPAFLDARVGPLTARVGVDPVAHDKRAQFPAQGVEVDATWGTTSSPVDRVLASAVASATPSTPAPTPTVAAAPATGTPVLAARAASSPGAFTAQASAAVASSTFTGMAFDTCSAPSVTSMKAWLSSPYRAAGIYIGGSMRACGDGNLSASWVSQVRALGFGLLPLYVGVQAPCVYQSGLAMIVASKAAAQGTSSADDAVSRAKFFGLGAGTPIYYDMEAYNSGVTGCKQTVMKFISAWTAELHRLGYKSGAYGSTASLMVNMATSVGSTGFSAPDDVWFAHWNQLQNTSDASSYPAFSDSYWRSHQRVHQYAGGANQSWGGVSLNIDANWVDAAVAGTAVPVNYGTNVLGPGSSGFVFTGSMTYWRPGAPAGLKRMAYWTYSNGSTEANGATWSPHLAPGRYAVQAYIPSTNATAKAPYTITDALGTTHRILSQQSNGAYASLGTYTAKAGSSIVVHVGDNDPSATKTKIGVDAMAFRLVVTVPGAPTGVAATPGNGRAVVSWSAPASNGGAPITAYKVTASPGGRTASTTGATTATVTGLANATAYTFTVTATNSIGTSAASAASTPVTPKGPPDAPTGVAASSADRSATVSWSAPAFDGGSAVTGYTVVAIDASNRNARSTVCAGSLSSTTTSCTATGLTNGHVYTFTVAAANAIGTGPASTPSTAVTPATVPTAPTSVSAASGDGAARVTWSAPYNGGAPITGYTATAEPGGATCSTTTATTTSCTIAGLLDGTAYTVTVTASNRMGISQLSSPASVTPLARSTTTATVPAAATYGHVYAIPVTVSSALDVSGTVTAKAGTTTLGTATLGASTYSNGRYTATTRILVPGTAVPTGAYRIAVTYHGDPDVASSTSAAGAVTIRKEATTTSARLSTSRVRHRAHAKITMTVAAWGTTPTGVLAVYDGTTRISRVLLSRSANGTITIALPLLRPGTHRLTVHYRGNRNLRPSTSRTLVLRSL
ncbi:MAG: hypothetical protein JWQ32_3082 [Marmoricola sp.]|nr:hypothetical protein [Marmoricola sp.]